MSIPQARLPVLNSDGTFNLPWYNFFQQLALDNIQVKQLIDNLPFEFDFANDVTFKGNVKINGTLNAIKGVNITGGLIIDSIAYSDGIYAIGASGNLITGSLNVSGGVYQNGVVYTFP
jgi:hypothetical protein